MKVIDSFKIMYGSEAVTIEKAMEIADIIRNSGTLKDLYLRNNTYEKDGFQKIIESCQVNSSLEKIFIFTHIFRSEHNKALDELLRKNITLQELNLSSYDFTTEQIKQIVDNLKENNSLTTFSLRANSSDGNILPVKTLIGICDDALSINTTLEKVEIIFDDYHLPEIQTMLNVILREFTEIFKERIFSPYRDRIPEDIENLIQRQYLNRRIGTRHFHINQDKLYLAYEFEKKILDRYNEYEKLTKNRNVPKKLLLDLLMNYIENGIIKFKTRYKFKFREFSILDFVEKLKKIVTYEYNCVLRRLDIQTTDTSSYKVLQKKLYELFQKNILDSLIHSNNQKIHSLENDKYISQTTENKIRNLKIMTMVFDRMNKNAQNQIVVNVGNKEYKFNEKRISNIILDEMLPDTFIQKYVHSRKRTRQKSKSQQKKPMKKFKKNPT